MAQIYDILDKAKHKTGYTVPDNYFDNVRSKIMAELPKYEEPTPAKLSMWQRVQPYIYMAAMFAGIWCMMKMFHMMSSTDLTLDNPPESVAIAMSDTNHYDWMDMEPENSDAFQIEYDLSGEYTSIEEFKEDFNQM